MAGFISTDLLFSVFSQCELRTQCLALEKDVKTKERVPSNLTKSTSRPESHGSENKIQRLCDDILSSA